MADCQGAWHHLEPSTPAYTVHTWLTSSSMASAWRPTSTSSRHTDLRVHAQQQCYVRLFRCGRKAQPCQDHLVAFCPSCAFPTCPPSRLAALTPCPPHALPPTSFPTLTAPHSSPALHPGCVQHLLQHLRPGDAHPKPPNSPALLTCPAPLPCTASA